MQNSSSDEDYEDAPEIVFLDPTVSNEPAPEVIKSTTEVCPQIPEPTAAANDSETVEMNESTINDTNSKAEHHTTREDKILDEVFELVEETENINETKPVATEIQGANLTTEEEEKTNNNSNNEEEPQVVMPETTVDEDLALELKQQGNTLFKQKQYDDALYVYTNAFSCIPEDEVKLKSIICNNKAACYSKLAQWEEVVEEVTLCLSFDENYLKAIIRRAEAYEKLKKYSKCVDDWTAVQKLDPKHKVAKKKIRKLKPKAEAEFEQQKTEMMGQMKDLGNKFLGWFGMSVDDFELNQNGDGGYSVGMKEKQTRL